MLDWYQDPYPTPCVDCAVLTTGASQPVRSARDGSFNAVAENVRPALRGFGLAPYAHYLDGGLHCGRAP
jgi:hypothetical protein